MPTKPTPKRQRGRQEGWTKEDEPKTKKILLGVTPSTYAWFKGLPRGALVKMVEEMAKGANHPKAL